MKKQLIILFLILPALLIGNARVQAVSNGPDNEILLYDGNNLQFTKSDNGFLNLVSNSNPNDHGPNNWKTPIDYWNGQFQVRYQVLGLGKLPGRMQVCIWTRADKNGDGIPDGYYPETCSGNVSYTKVGDVMYNPIPYPNGKENGFGGGWYRKEGTIDYSKPADLLIRNVLRGENGCNVMPHAGSNVCKKTSSNTYAEAYNLAYPDYQNLKFRITIVLVPKGQEFSGWQNYGFGGTGPTPVVTPTPDSSVTPTNSVTPTYNLIYDVDENGVFNIRDVLDVIKFLFT